MTLNITRRSGSYGPSSGLATTPSRPAPSNWANHSRASAGSVVAGVTCTGGPAAASACSSAARRSANGRPVQSVSSSASRSNATNEAGVCPASSRTRLSAGCTRWSRASKSSRRPSPAGMMISPSITQRAGMCLRTASTSSGKYLVIGRSLRLPISTSAPSRKMTERKPSHLGS